MLAVASGEVSQEQTAAVSGPEFWVEYGEMKDGQVLHAVWEFHGACNRGKRELKGVVAWFTDRKDALDYALFRQRQTRGTQTPAGGNA